MLPDIDKKKVAAWAFYDWANSAFATTVMAGFFPIFLKEYWSAGSPATMTTSRLGTANSIASVIIVVLAPVLGTIADKASVKKKFLFFFAALGVVMTGSLFFVQQGHWQVALALYVLATIGFSGGNIFYDALILSIAPKSRMDLVSALGFSAGYLGGGLLFALNVLMTLYPGFFGFSDSSQAVRVSFLLVAAWWAVFSIPIFLFVPEPDQFREGMSFESVKGGFRQLKETFREIRALRTVFLFLLGYWLYIDGVDTIVRMAVDYGLSLGFDSGNLIVALLLTQFVGFPAAIAFGKIGEKLGARTGIFICIGVYILVTLWAVFLSNVSQFYQLALAIGLVQGGIQSLSRSYYTRLIPENKSAEFFGFYNMLGKFAAVIGPLMMGQVAVWTGSSRLSILSIVILFIAGGAFLWFVDEDQGRMYARKLEEI